MLTFIGFVVVILLLISWANQNNDNSNNGNAQIDTTLYDVIEYDDIVITSKVYQGDLSKLEELEITQGDISTTFKIIRKFSLNGKHYLALVWEYSDKIIFLNYTEKNGIVDVKNILTANEYISVGQAFEELEDSGIKKEEIKAIIKKASERKYDDINFGGKRYTLDQFAVAFCGGNKSAAITLCDKLIKEGQAEYYNEKSACNSNKVSATTNEYKNNPNSSKPTKQPSNHDASYDAYSNVDYDEDYYEKKQEQLYNDGYDEDNEFYSDFC